MHPESQPPQYNLIDNLTSHNISSLQQILPLEQQLTQYLVVVERVGGEEGLGGSVCDVDCCSFGEGCHDFGEIDCEHVGIFVLSGF